MKDLELLLEEDARKDFAGVEFARAQAVHDILNQKEQNF